MDNSRKKYILLAIVIIIPLLLSFLVGLYGYNSDKFGQGAWKDEYRKEYLEFDEELNTKEKIEEYLNYGVSPLYHSYNENAVVTRNIKVNEEDEDSEVLFKLAIYQAFIERDESNDKDVDQLQYLIFIYDVQYLKLRGLFDAEGILKEEIDAADVPTIIVKMKEDLEVDEDSEVNPKEKQATMNYARYIRDLGSDVDTYEGDVIETIDPDEAYDFIYIHNSSFTITAANDFVSDVLFEISIEVPGIKDNDGKDLSEVVSTFEVSRFDTIPEDVDTSDFVESYRQDLNKTGYFGWLVKNYLWWIYLIAFVAMGAITFSFYAVWVAEEKQKLEKVNKKQRR